jgi:hypothetical protein
MHGEETSPAESHPDSVPSAMKRAGAEVIEGARSMAYLPLMEFQLGT